MIGFLHTAEVHVPRFGRLMSEEAPGVPVTHLVDTSLLADARVEGRDGLVRAGVAARLAELLEGGAVEIVCTCSTIGGIAEELGALRVDRPMAEEAVRIARSHGGRIAVVAAVESTIGPTRALLLDSAQRMGAEVTLVEAPCLDAWPIFEAGEVDAFLDAIAAHVVKVAESADVVVLAQASMADVAERDLGLKVPVLASPRSGVRAVVRGLKR